MSLRVRLLLAFGYLLLFTFIALEVPLSLNFSRRVHSEIRAEASASAEAIASAASGQLTKPGPLATLARQQARDLGGRVIVVGPDGSVLVDSDGAAARGTPYGGRPEIAQALHGETAQGTRYSSSLHANLLYTAVPIVDAGRTIGAVRVTQSVKAVDNQVRRDVLALLALGGGVLLLGLGLAWVIAGSLSRPLRDLARTARRVAGGDLQARASPSGSSDHVEVANAFSDMTERLVRALGAQREFVANASHQLRTPRTGLRLRLESAGLKASHPDLHDDLAAGDTERLTKLLSDLQRDLQAGEVEAERLAKLLTDLLHLARDGQPPPAASSIAFATVAEHAAERWRDQAERDGHRLELTGDGDPYVRASTGDLETMIDNLIENALNYSKPDTPIRIEWGTDTEGPFIAVLDNGPGLDEKDTEHAFERFYRGTASRDGRVLGTGLGLAIVETLAHRWQMHATLTNRPDGGARAQLHFQGAEHPITNATAVAPTPTHPVSS